MSLIGRHKLAVVTLVSGSSMFPTLPSNGAVVLCNPLPVWRDQLQPGTTHVQPQCCTICQPTTGDVVMFQCMERCYLICKRIIALEGETITYVPPLATRHGAHPPPQQITVRECGYAICQNHCIAHKQVPPGHMWVEGDNPPHSHDSRYFGPVPMALATTKLEFVVCVESAVVLQSTRCACAGMATGVLGAGCCQTWSKYKLPLLMRRVTCCACNANGRSLHGARVDTLTNKQRPRIPSPAANARTYVACWPAQQFSEQ